MKLKNICNDLNLDMSDKYYIIFLACFSILITLMIVKFHQSRGAFNSDIYVYLASALDFAGMNYNHISSVGALSNSPFICYLTSLLFKLGFVHVNSIYFVTSIFSISGIFAMYILLKARFSNMLSLVGALLYSSFSLTLFYFANGMLDVPAVALMLWTLIFTVAAADKNPKYYILVGLFFAMSFFTRFTTGFIVILVALYILKDYDLINLAECLFQSRDEFKQRLVSFFKSSEFKWMCISIIIVAAIVAYVFYVISSFNAPVNYLNTAANSVDRFHRPRDPNYILDKFFYVKNYLSLLFANEITSPMQIEKFSNPSVMSYLMMAILFFGFLIKSINVIKNKDFYRDNIRKIPFRSPKSENVLKIAVVVLFILSVISFKFNYIYTVILMWMALVILQSLIKKYDSVNINNFSLSLVCFGLFSFYMAIFSFMHLKCVRYILPTLPAFAYFVIYALDSILNYIKYGWEDKSSDKPKVKSDFRLRASQILPIIMIVLLLFTAFNFTNTVEIDDLSLNFHNAANFLLDHDQDYQSKDIGVNTGDRYYEWYFKKDVDRINPNRFNSSDYDYVFVYDDLDNPDYHEIYRHGIVGVYERNF